VLPADETVVHPTFEDFIMLSKWKLAVASTLLTCSAVTAFAAGSTPLAGDGAYPSNVEQQAATQPKTRAQVLHELDQAYKDGFLPLRGDQYPPSAETIAQNRAAYASAHHVPAVEASVSSNAQ
jgi:hypothetical protein